MSSSSSTSSNTQGNSSINKNNNQSQPVDSNIEAINSFSSTESSSSTSSPDSPASKHFFGAISSRIRGRSRSRSRSPAPRTKKSTSPTMTKRESMPSSSRKSFDSDSPTLTNDSVKGQKMERQGSDRSDRSDFQRMTYGRHSGDWLFGGFSVRDTLKGVSKRGRSSSRSS